MSMSFEVFPTHDYIPNNDEITLLSQKYLIDYLKNQNIDIDIRIVNRTYCLEEDGALNSKNLVNNEKSYQSFIINEIGQVTIFYNKLDNLSKDFWKDELVYNSRAKQLENLIDRSIELGYSWSIKRTMGQPSIIGLYYGFLAISIAKLTGGIIYSDDGAWDYEYLPITAKDFENQYLDLSKLKNRTIIDFVTNCIEDLKKHMCHE